MRICKGKRREQKERSGSVGCEQRQSIKNICWSQNEIRLLKKWNVGGRPLGFGSEGRPPPLLGGRSGPDSASVFLFFFFFFVPVFLNKIAGPTPSTLIGLRGALKQALSQPEIAFRFFLFVFLGKDKAAP